MASNKQIIYPSEKKILADFGERLRLARLRRQLSAETVAARSNISRMTLHRAEKGSPEVSLGTYFRILTALHLENDVNLIAKDDELGRKLQDLELSKKREF